MQDIDAGTDILKVAAVFGTIAAAIGVVVVLLLSGFAWWLALLVAGGMVWAEIVCWTMVFQTARGREAEDDARSAIGRGTRARRSKRLTVGRVST